MWRQLKPPVKKKELERMLQKQETCFISKFIISYEPGARMGRVVPNRFASCIYHNGMAAILEDEMIEKPTVSDPNILQELERMYQPVGITAKEKCLEVQEYITQLYESGNDAVQWISIKKLLKSYAGYIRNAERLPDPHRLEHTIYRKMKESIEIWESVMNRKFIKT